MGLHTAKDKLGAQGGVTVAGGGIASDVKRVLHVDHSLEGLKGWGVGAEYGREGKIGRGACDGTIEKEEWVRG